MQDIRDAFRALKSSPIVTAVAVLSLALGIGANTAIFSILDSLVLRTLPVKAPQQLALVGLNGETGILHEPAVGTDADAWQSRGRHRRMVQQPFQPRAEGAIRSSRRHDGKRHLL